ncbi:MAG TPA: GNAT family N-acetyltransferase [Jatrophihabitans sp.]|jgi:RimJ/RimL family protein N-acetyltransferase|uniref:GNAT family N-acetyltransferase n=1 Tax=Jatrophihabitans sp. TaxID=1932789 RepID=UPI002F0DD1FC
MSELLRLELMTEDHLADFEQFLDDPDVLRFTRLPDPPPPGYATEWFDRCLIGRQNGTMEVFAAVAPDGTFLGIAIAPHIDAEAREMELGCMVTRAARGRGVATEMLRQLTDWAFTERQVLRATVLMDVNHVASQLVAARAGYTFEGVLRSAHFKQGIRSDIQLWSRLPTDGPAGDHGD